MARERPRRWANEPSDGSVAHFKGAGPRISRPHGFTLAEEHGDLLVPDMDGTGFYEVSLRSRAKTLVGRGFSRSRPSKKKRGADAPL